MDTENITMNEDGTLTIACGEYTTATRKTESATAPEVPTQFANYYTADNVLSSTELGTTAKVTLEGKTQPNLEEMDVEWSIVDANGASAEYDATPEATNIFKWTVKESEYADYDKDTAVLEGTVTIQNKDYTPVTITITVNKAEVAPNKPESTMNTVYTNETVGKATYKVTISDLTKGTVTYVAPTDAKATTVTIPATVVIDGVTYKVTAIEKNAFKNNKYIKKVIIGNNIITIGDNAFYGCKKLKTVTIGKSVTKIGSKAFYGCSKIKTLTIKSTKLTTKKIGSKAFTKTPKKMTVKVPKSKLKSYKKLLKAKGVNSRAKIKK